jgi:hypothetical protein
VDLGVTVLARLGGGHLDDLAGAVLDDDKAVLPQCGTLHGEGGRGTGIGALEGVLMLQAMGLAWGRARAGDRDGDGDGGAPAALRTCTLAGAGYSTVQCARERGARGTYLRVVGHGD